MTDAFQKWRDARRQLNDAMQAYSTAIIALNSTIRANVKAWDTNFLDSLALEAQFDSNLIESGLQILGEGRAVLNGIRNKSLKRVPANKLPSEVLIEVFRLFARESPRYYHDPACSGQHFSLQRLSILSHVCVEWRKLILATPSFWPHLDMTLILRARKLSNPLHCIQTSVQRAAGLPLCLDFDFSPGRASHTVASLISSDLFLPYHNSLQIQSLYLINSEANTHFSAMIARIFQSARPEFIQSLVIWRDDDHAFDPFVIGDTIGEGAVTVLPALRVFRLNNMAFGWENPVYRKLVHLHIGGIFGQPEGAPGIDELLSILSSCPELEILQLQQLCIQPSSRLQPQPVVLEKLKVLDLMFMPDYYVPILLPLLAIPPANPLSLRLSLSDISGTITATFQNFLARTNVTRLYAFGGGRGEGKTLQTYLTGTPRLTTLILDCNGEEVDPYLDVILESPVALCPMLRSLYLHQAKGKIETLCEFVEGYPSLKNLFLIDLYAGAPRNEIIDTFKLMGLETVDVYSADTSYEEYAWYHTMP